MKLGSWGNTTFRMTEDKETLDGKGNRSGQTWNTNLVNGEGTVQKEELDQYGEVPAGFRGETLRLDANAECENLEIRDGSRRDGRLQGALWVHALGVAGQLPWASTRGDLSRTVAALVLLGTTVSLAIGLPAEKRTGVTTGLGLLVYSTNHQVIDFSSEKKLVTNYPMGASPTDATCQRKLQRMVMRARRPSRLQDQEAVGLRTADF